MKSYDAYLFDWDGTLGRTLELWLEVIRTEFERHDLQLSDTEVVATFGRLRPAAEGHGLPADQVKELWNAVKDQVAKRSVDIDMYPDALDMLYRLKQSGKKLAVITTNWAPVAKVMLEQHNLDGVFDAIITGDDVTAHKPDPEGIHKALALLDVPHEQAVMLGDSDKDLGAAENAGIDSILFYPPSHQLFYSLDKLKEHKPVAVIDSWEYFGR